MAMDSESQPLLADTEANLGNPGDSAAGSFPQPEHVCARCSAEMRSCDSKEAKINWRLFLILMAIFLSCSVFSLVVTQMAEAANANFVGISVAIWTDVTIAVLTLLLYFGRRPGHKLGLTYVQVRVLCALGLSWIFLIVGMVGTNHSLCRWASVSCGLFTSGHVLTWFLVITLFAAAYATYRQALTIHGTGTTIVPVPVAAWRLANVGDGEGAVKI
ncbi:hypothetical protein K438DRAFT_1953871 [Mycena galopus ATCC 62051]|nr:hypothetical protein K438DRAFT_1953871 [Mycena galopus ATCC 62051]